MWEDPIVKETRAAREELLKRFNYDLDALCAYLSKKWKRQAARRPSHWNHKVRPPTAKHRNCFARLTCAPALCRRSRNDVDPGARLNL
jgi:hypothetical protein